MDLHKYEQKFYELKGMHVSKVISDEAYKAGIKSLKIKDSNGDWCKIDEATGQWLVFDGDEWVQKQPALSLDVANQMTDEVDGTEDFVYEDIIEYVASYEDDSDDYLVDPEVLQGDMKELAEVDFDDEIRRLMANASDKEIFDDEDVATYEISRNPQFYDDQAHLLRTEDQVPGTPSTVKRPDAIGGVSKSTQPSVTGTPPEITPEILSMFNVTAAAAVKTASTAMNKVKKVKAKGKTDDTCSSCDSPLKAGQKFCGKCGTSTEKKVPKGQCPKCGTQNAEISNFCKKCGRKLG